MSAVWYVIPSKRPPEEAERCLKLWRERGYKIALWRDDADGRLDSEILRGPQNSDHPVYPGYARATNELISALIQISPNNEWFVCGGDDVEPDANHSAEEIAEQCSAHFSYLHEVPAPHPKATFGVMQPSGDRYGESAGSIATYGSDRAAYADRVCGSPWIGREFASRVNQGRGPLWPEYFHMFEDEELFEVASKLGVLWMRRDLIHLHNHWARKRGDVADMPEFLKEASGAEHWKKYGAIFRARKATGFPGSELSKE